jgi:hypothetical protein
VEDVQKLLQRHDELVGAQVELLTWRVELFVAVPAVPVVAYEGLHPDEDALVLLIVACYHVRAAPGDEPERANLGVILGLTEKYVVVFAGVVEQSDDVLHRLLTRIDHRPIWVREGPNELKGFGVLNVVVALIDPRPHFEDYVHPRLVLEEGVSVDLPRGLVVVDEVVDCVLDNSALDYRCHVVVPFFVDYGGFDQVGEMLLGNHPYLG